MIVALASDYTQLALHALALVPIAGPANLFEPGYVRWARTHLPPGAVEPIMRDAALISAHAGRGLQSAPELFEDLEQLRASARIDELRPRDVHRVWALEGWRESPLSAELLRAAMGLAAAAFRDAWPRARCLESLRLHREIFERAACLLPALEGTRVELAWALGSRGRAFPERLLAGVPLDWTGLAAEIPAVVVLHEALVRDAGGPYEVAEWRALSELAARMAGQDGALPLAHRAWLASLSLSYLIRSARERGECDKASARALLDAPDERPERLASLRARLL